VIALCICALIDGYVPGERLAGINLTRAANSSSLSRTNLPIFSDPTRLTSYGKNDPQQFHGYSKGPHHDAAIEIDIWVELSLDEVRIVQGGLLEP
jgi:hypothetical protein